ncbi:MAG: DUF4430 domain-containing protein [Atopobiaceae bacterium]|nr:DUF4430 domain-containing protein [Atopobiaceae bacterium]
MSQNNLSRRTFVARLVGGLAACALALTVVACGGTGAAGAAGGNAVSAGQEQQATIEVTVEIDATAGEGEKTTAEVELPEGATAYDALVAAADDVNASDSEYGMYVQGINGLAGGDFGDMSGWMFEVNGEMAEVAASELELEPGDVVTWLYVTEFTE